MLDAARIAYSHRRVTAPSERLALDHVANLTPRAIALEIGKDPRALPLGLRQQVLVAEPEALARDERLVMGLPRHAHPVMDVIGAVEHRVDHPSDAIIDRRGCKLACDAAIEAPQRRAEHGRDRRPTRDAEVVRRRDRDVARIPDHVDQRRVAKALCGTQLAELMMRLEATELRGPLEALARDLVVPGVPKPDYRTADQLRHELDDPRRAALRIARDDDIDHRRLLPVVPDTSFGNGLEPARAETSIAS